MENLEQIHHPSYLSLSKHYATAFFATVKDAIQVIEDLEAVGFEPEDFSVYEGPQGVKSIDLDGKNHSIWSEYRRKISKFSDGAEWHFLTDAENELRNSHILLLIPTQGKDTKEYVIQCLKKNGGFGIRYTTNFTIEEIS